MEKYKINVEIKIGDFRRFFFIQTQNLSLLSFFARTNKNSKIVLTLKIYSVDV